MNTAPTWRPIDLGAVFKRIDRRFKWIGDHDVIFLVVFGLLFFAFSDVLMAGRLTPAGNSLSFIAAVLWSVLGLVFLVVYCLLLYSFVNQPEKRRLLRGVSCFFVLLLAVVSYYAGLFSLYGQSVNFVDRDVAERKVNGLKNSYWLCRCRRYHAVLIGQQIRDELGTMRI